jgi:large subunit ribosomal protein L19
VNKKSFSRYAFFPLLIINSLKGIPMQKNIINNLHMQAVNKPLTYGVGDLVQVHYKITEGNKERIQIYEGTIIAIQNSGSSKAVVVRRVSYDVGVERIFPIYSPNVEKIVKVRSSKVRRAKLYYLREKIGKSGRLKEVKKADRKDPVFERAEVFRKELDAKAAANAPAPVEVAPEATVE